MSKALIDALKGEDIDKNQPDCVNVPHKPGECYWCDMVDNVLKAMPKKVK